MNSIIYKFKQIEIHFSTESDAARAIWCDAVGDAFYRDIIFPLKENANELEVAMEELSTKLNEISKQIKKI